MLTSLDIITTKWIHHALWLFYCVCSFMCLCLCLYLLYHHASVLAHTHGFGFRCLFVCLHGYSDGGYSESLFRTEIPGGGFPRVYQTHITGYEPRPDQPGL